ncbi:hypothetical protein [Variovorax sp. E3]|nr:hypothetical protein [Variovorax sp. E3]
MQRIARVGGGQVQFGHGRGQRLSDRRVPLREPCEAGLVQFLVARAL